MPRSVSDSVYYVRRRRRGRNAIDATSNSVTGRSCGVDLDVLLDRLAADDPAAEQALIAAGAAAVAPVLRALREEPIPGYQLTRVLQRIGEPAFARWSPPWPMLRRLRWHVAAVPHSLNSPSRVFGVSATDRSR